MLLALLANVVIADDAKEIPKSTPIKAGTKVNTDLVCFDDANRVLLQGKIERCNQTQKNLAACKVALDELPESSPLGWFESPWFWGFVGLALGIGLHFTF